MVLRSEAAYGKSFRVQPSDGATTWRTAYSTTAGAGAVQDPTGPTGSDCHIRVYGARRGTTYGYSLHESEVYGSP